MNLPEKIRCSRCHKYKTPAMFGKSKNGKYGLYHQCKECANARYRKIRKSNQGRTPEEVESKRLELRPTGVKRCITCCKDKPLTEFYRVRHEPDGLGRKCKDCNDRYVVALLQGRRGETIAQLVEMYGIAVCFKCGSDENIEIDHVHPASRGGSDSIDNYQLLCKKCNMQKSANFADYRPLHKQVVL